MKFLSENFSSRITDVTCTEFVIYDILVTQHSTSTQMNTKSVFFNYFNDLVIQ